MSLCQAGQVLLTKEAMKVVRNRTNTHTPKGTRYVCVGLYQFKGVKKPQEIFAVGESIEALQPPPGSEKVKRVGGPKKIKSRARDRKIKEWVEWLAWRVGTVAVILWICFLSTIVVNPTSRSMFLGMSYHIPFIDDNYARAKKIKKWLMTGHSDADK